MSGSLAENESDGSVSSNDEANVGLSSEENDENRDSEKEGLENDEEAEMENETNILVAYFSATNTTEGVAKTIAEISTRLFRKTRILTRTLITEMTAVAARSR